MIDVKGAWVPHNPKGIPLPKLSRMSEASAWRALMDDQEKLKYNGRTQFEMNGWQVLYDSAAYPRDVP